MQVPALPPRGNSWVIVRKATGKAVFETYDAAVVAALNPDVADAIPASVYLADLNKRIAGGEMASRNPWPPVDITLREPAVDLTPIGLQYVIPGCERDDDRGPAQLPLF